MIAPQKHCLKVLEGEKEEEEEEKEEEEEEESVSEEHKYFQVSAISSTTGRYRNGVT